MAAEVDRPGRVPHGVSPVWYQLLTRTSPRPRAYLLALATSLATLGTADLLLNETDVEFRSLPVIAPIASAVLWDTGPAVLSSVLTAVGVDLLLVAPKWTSFDTVDSVLRIGLYTAIGATLGSLVGSMRQAVAQIDRYRLHAEQVARDLVALTVHDLKGATTGLGLGLDLIERDVAAWHTARGPRLLATQRRTLKGMDRLVADLQDAVRIDLGRFTLDPREVEVGELVASTLAAWRPQADARGVTLEADVPVEAVRVRCDRVDQVFGNLIGNALRHAPTGSRIVVRVRPDEADVRFDVVDQGPGIPEADREHLFEAYWNGRASKGTGLGLFIARGVVAANGGRIALVDSGEHGSTFRFTLPRPLDQDAPAH